MRLSQGRADAAHREDRSSELKAAYRSVLRRSYGRMASRIRPAAALRRRVGELEADNLRLFRMAYMDPLTSLWNRNKLDEEFHAVLRNAVAAGGNATVVMMDLNKLKAVNDTHGHLAGDEYIRSFASLLQRNLRQGDSAFRFGGDEFLLLCPGIGSGSAIAIVKRLREQANSAGISFSAGVSDLKSALIAGVTPCNLPSLALAILEQADRKVYWHKGIQRLR